MVSDDVLDQDAILTRGAFEDTLIEVETRKEPQSAHNGLLDHDAALRARIEELEGALEDVTDLIEDARTRAFEPGGGGMPDLEWVREPLNEAKRRARRAPESDHGETDGE